MKKITTSLFLFFFFLNFSFTQIVVETTELIVEENDFNLTDNYAEIIIENFLGNESMEDINVRWTFIEDTCPDEWEFIKADELLTYISTVTSNIDPALNIDNPILLEAGETGSTMFLFLYPRQVAGCCQVGFEFSDANDPTATPIASATYDISINDPDCQLINYTFEIDNNRVKIYPNPTSDFLKIESTSPIELVNFFSVNGQDLGEVNLSENNEVDLSSMSKGIYFLKIKMKNGKVSWTKISRN